MAKVSVVTSPMPAVPARVSRFRRGYQVAAVNALVQRVSAFLSGDPSTIPVTADELHAIAFPSQRGGYDETEVDGVIDLLIALVPSSRGVIGMLRGGAATGSFGLGVSGAESLDPVTGHVPGELRDPRFTPTWRRRGYVKAEIDALVDRLNMGFALTDIRDRDGLGRILDTLRETTVRTNQSGYDMPEVDAWWKRVDELLAAAAAR